jgi:hypothetical protein
MYRVPNNPIKDGFLSSIVPKRKSIAIILDSLASNQIAFEALLEVHKAMPSDIEYVIFSQDWNAPILTPPTAVYHTAELIDYTGNVIATSINSLIDCLKLKTINKIIWYIYNPHEIELYSKDEIIKLTSNKSLTIVCRSTYHQSTLENKGIKSQVVSSFNIKELSNLIFKGKKNDN